MHSDTNYQSTKSISLLKRRWQKFRLLKRGWYSFLIILFIYLLTFLLPLLVNNRALIVKYHSSYYFPAFGNFYQAKFFGQRAIGETQYRKLKNNFNRSNGDHWVLMPPYPFHPTESLLTDPALPGSPPILQA